MRGSEPSNFGRNANTLRKSIEDLFTYVVRAADAVQEFGLHEARNSERGGGKGDAERWPGSDKEELINQHLRLSLVYRHTIEEGKSRLTFL